MDQVFQRGVTRRGLSQIMDVQGVHFIQREFTGFSKYGERFVPLSLFDEYENRVYRERGE
jgi:hypothetical protein